MTTLARHAPAALVTTAVATETALGRPWAATGLAAAFLLEIAAVSLWTRLRRR